MVSDPSTKNSLAGRGRKLAMSAAGGDLCAIDPITLLRRMERMALADPELSAWLARGLELWRSGEPLDHALGLAGADAIRARNAALLSVSKLLDEPGLSPWGLAGRLEAAIRRFESVTLPRIRRGEEVPLDPIQRAILAALEAGAGMVRSRRRLFDLLR